MCGIAGFIDFNCATSAETGEQALRRMSDRIRHRGPDDWGMAHHPEQGVFFAHRRLSIVDLSAAGHQPMNSGGGRYLAVYNGEIYNHKALRAELEAIAPRTWRGHSDTEVMLAAFDTWGVEKSLARFVGMFAIAVWDRAERSFTLVRDRAGEKPLYWGVLAGKLAFASEAKAFEGLPGARLSLDPQAVPLMLRFGHVPAPYSIFEGVHKLMPGEWMRFHGGVQPVARGFYWSAAASLADGVRNPLQLSPEQAVDELERLLSEAVQLQLEADVPVGAFLSGGIDSSTVVALAQRSLTSKVRTFSIGFDDKAFDESEHARAVANHLGTDHTELKVSSQDALDAVPLMAKVYDEPFADSSQIPTYLVAQLARRDVTVSLSGDGGDELFAGYPRYGRTQSVHQWLSRLPGPSRRMVAGAVERVPAGFWNQAAGVLGRRRETAAHRTEGDKLLRVAQMLRLPPHLIYKYMASPMPELRRLLPGSAEPRTVYDDPSAWPSTRSPAETAMWLDFMAYLPDDLLTKVDRATMAVSLESRVPLLDHRVIEFSHRLPEDLKVRDGMRKWVLRQVLYRHVPRALVDRPKMGFSVPLGAWLRGPLREWAQHLLFSPAVQDMGIDPRELRRIWDEQQAGTRDWQHALWSILMLRGWQEGRAEALPAAA